MKENREESKKKIQEIQAPSPQQENMARKLTKSKSRIRDHGEVFTPDFIIEDMLDLVKQETERIDSRFLEPACGNGNFDKLEKAKNLKNYLKTKFFRFLLLQALTSINISKDKFYFVPMQDFSQSWTDEKLYKKYGLTKKEIEFIESMIRPME